MSTGSRETLDAVIRAAKRELERMIDLAPQGMLLADDAGRIQRANAGLLRLLQLPGFQDVLGEEFRGLLGIADGTDPWRTLTGIMADARGEAGLAECELALVLGVRNLVLHFTCISAGVGEPLLALMIEDVTERKRASEAKERSDRLEAIEALVGALLHTINQPLTVIMANAHLIRRASRAGAGGRPDMDQYAGEIMQMVEQIAEVLKKAQSLQEFVLQPYHGDVQILDIEASGGPGGAPGDGRSRPWPTSPRA